MPTPGPNREESHNRSPSVAAPPAVVILGIPFHNVSFADTVEWVRQRVRSRRPAYIATVNMDFVTQAWRDPELQRILLEADLVVADGIPIVWLSRILGHPLKERVTGSDLVPMFAELAAREGFSLFGLGGAPGVAERATAKLVERYPGLRIAGCYSPPKADILDMDNAGILARIEAAAPDILLVAFGAPKQEKWVNLHIRRWQVPVSIGIGGSLDFLAGAQKRAPRWVQRLALEWLWRMLSDPRRLFRRYIANIAFLSGAVIRLLRLRWGTVPPRVTPAAEQAEPAAASDASAVCRVPFPAAAAGRDFDAFRAACEADPARPLVVDLGERDWLDIREQGVLLDLNRRSRSAQRWLCVLAPHPRLAHLLQFVRLDRYIPVAPVLPEALRLLQAWQQTSREGCVRIEPDGRLFVRLPAELTAANAAGFRTDVEAAWNRAVGGEVAGVAVDAAGVAFLDSAGLGLLVALRKKALPLPGGFRCSGFRGNARQTLVIARMEALFKDDAAGTGGAP